ncbi:hypothetical protein ASPACDRAFT_56974 [Aspergillus aculeatus ATCC 16872]|uniref:BTB domain-containing protein n=1 Tax=Aspergillus aculeatus (strain ATCC 16872 / CBS 172.66 / WB 5094) TaxID=690307 RepID=A0A1L9X567_ASPA1|nr:uncharacterized protein ASPACDRAFT_56974 [Aspergillus aculeatus ATCC 16872]OJK03583.1 hypothetical protein ASPACDRAFT_56974 [Aspergillus aculeatus ATCC 16872]
MNAKFANSISSRLFTFIVGSEEKRITIHSDVLTSLSSELDSLLNERFRRGQRTRLVVCQGGHIHPAVRVRSQLRAGAKPSLPRPSKDKSRIYDRSAAQSDRPGAGSGAAAQALPRIFNPSSTRDASNHLHTCLTTKRGQVSEERKKAYAPRKIPLHLQRQLTSNLLGYAKLCVLAEQYGIVPLKDIVLEKLATTLGEFELFEDHVDYFIELVRFSYLHTRPRDDEGFCLRDLLATYVLSRLKQLYDSAKFLNFARKGGDFVVEVRQKSKLSQVYQIWTVVPTLKPRSQQPLALRNKIATGVRLSGGGI